MNEPITVTGPDPSWHYYELYLSILDAKTRFDELLLVISLEETVNSDSDVKFRNALVKLKEEIQNIINKFLADEEINDE
jgi:hypothetical protein